MSRRDPLVYVRHMLDHAQEALDITSNRSRPELDTDRMLNLALVRLLEVIGEASRRVPDEFRTRYPNVPWRDTSGFRNRLIHAYDEIDFDIVWEIVQTDLLPLIAQLESIIAEHKQPSG